jgi:cyclase
MPLCYGGGIQNIEHVKKLVSLGVEKVSLNTAILDNYDLIAEISKLYGSQNVVASVDINRNLLGGYFNYKAKNSNLFQHFKNIVDSGAGEILINCVHKDGTLSGPDFKLLKNLINEIKIPITYVGGVSSIIDIEKAFEFGVSAIGAGSFFIYYGKHKAVLISYPKLNFINGIKTSM